jgi:hypothetical protein
VSKKVPDLLGMRPSEVSNLENVRAACQIETAKFLT